MRLFSNTTFVNIKSLAAYDICFNVATGWQRHTADAIASAVVAVAAVEVVEAVVQWQQWLESPEGANRINQRIVRNISVRAANDACRLLLRSAKRHVTCE